MSALAREGCPAMRCAADNTSVAHHLTASPARAAAYAERERDRVRTRSLLPHISATREKYAGESLDSGIMCSTRASGT
ncbi:MAG: hypothetical protein L6V35_06400 [Alistipes putredinis]|nr:MAG: hypothetical protein L6V35_06400 [Alistipes putredinis]